MEIISEFLGQIIKLVFYMVVLIGAVKLGIFFRKKKNATIKETSNE